MKIKYKYTTFSIIILLLFLVPFTVKTIDMRLELFPSVILPSSSGTIKIDKGRNVQRMELYGVTADGDTLQLDKGDFLKPIPKHYLYKLLLNKFGLEEYEYENAITNRFDIPFKIKSKVSSKEITETKAWLRNRLGKLGYVDSVLIVKKRLIRVSADMSIEDTKNVVNDTVYDLY